MDHQNRAAEAEQSFEKTEQVWEEIQGEVNQVMGSRIGPKKRNKGDLEVARNKEISTGERTRSELVWNKIGG